MLHLIVNPKSRKAASLLEEVEVRLQARGASYDVYRSEKVGDIRTHVFELTSAGETCIVAVGGDGTLNEVLCGISDPAKVVLGLVPAGTGNDFAAAAKIPVGVAAVDLILDSEPKFTDYLECDGGRRSINIAGLGIDVDVLDRLDRWRKEGKKGSYFGSLIRSLLTYKAIKMQVTADGETKDYHALIAAACNGSQFGGGIPICPPAVIDDGKMDLLVVDCPRRIKLLYYLLLLMKGKILTRKICHRILCEEARILPENGKVVQLDGELVAASELKVKVVSGKLRMYRG